MSGYRRCAPKSQSSDDISSLVQYLKVRTKVVSAAASTVFLRGRQAEIDSLPRKINRQTATIDARHWNRCRSHQICH